MAFVIGTAEKIIQEVAVQFCIKVSELRSESKVRKLSEPRQYCYVRLIDETPLSYPQIARILCRKDHTTVIYGERVCREKIKLGLI